MDIRTEQFEETLFLALEAVDVEMEERYGDKFRLHPARLEHGKAASRQYDGLFSLSAGFSAGYGSKTGPGYALDLRIVSLDFVPKSFRDQFENECVEALRKKLEEYFPERSLEVVKDVCGYKIVGDLHIGNA